MNIEKVLDRIEKLPKIDLHCHLEGSLSPVLAYERIKSRTVSETKNLISFDEFLDLVSIEDQARDILDFTGPYFRHLNSCLSGLDDVHEFTFDLMERAYQDNVRLIEVCVFPGFISGSIRKTSGVRFRSDEILTTISEAMKKAEDRYDMVSGIVVCFGAFSMKSDTYVDRIIEIKESLEDPELYVPIVGADIGDFDLDYFGLEPEVNSKISSNVSKLSQAGFGLKCHAGEALVELEGEDEIAVARETGTPDSMRKGIEYGVSRIGHGLAAAKDEALMKELSEKRINIELCPVSNYKTNIFKDYEKEYPIRKFLEKGISISINSDDTTIQRSTWKDDYLWAHVRFGLSMEQLQAIVANAYESSFIEDARKARFKDLFRIS